MPCLSVDSFRNGNGSHLRSRPPERPECHSWGRIRAGLGNDEHGVPGRTDAPRSKLESVMAARDLAPSAMGRTAMRVQLEEGPAQIRQGKTASGFSGPCSSSSSRRRSCALASPIRAAASTIATRLRCLARATTPEQGMQPRSKSRSRPRLCADTHDAVGGWQGIRRVRRSLFQGRHGLRWRETAKAQSSRPS